MIYGGGLVGIVLVLFWVYAFLEVIGTDESDMRNLPKIAWALIVFFGFGIGALAWFILGRPVAPGTRTSGVQRPSWRSAPPTAPPLEDSPGYGARMEEERLRSWEQELRRREEDLRRRENGGPEMPPS